MEPRIHRRVSRNAKKNAIPLYKLRTSAAARTVVEHPGRMGELVSMLEDKDLLVRGSAAATIARLAESHPGRLIRILDRIKQALCDDSAYVRWHAAYSLGVVGGGFSTRASSFAAELFGRLDDNNRVVRILSAKSLRKLPLESQSSSPICSSQASAKCPER